MEKEEGKYWTCVYFICLFYEQVQFLNHCSATVYLNYFIGFSSLQIICEYYINNRKSIHTKFLLMLLCISDTACSGYLHSHSSLLFLICILSIFKATSQVLSYLFPFFANHGYITILYVTKLDAVLLVMLLYRFSCFRCFRYECLILECCYVANDALCLLLLCWLWMLLFLYCLWMLLCQLLVHVLSFQNQQFLLPRSWTISSSYSS